MQVQAGLIGKLEHAVEGRQSGGIELTRLGVERAEGHEHSHHIHAHALHALEVLARGLGVKLLPQLGRPAGAWPVIAHAAGRETLAGGVHKTLSGGIDTDAGQLAADGHLSRASRLAGNCLRHAVCRRQRCIGGISRRDQEKKEKQAEDAVHCECLLDDEEQV